MNTTAQQAETAAQNYMRAVISADYHMTPERAAAKTAFLDALTTAYPTLNNTDIFDMWSGSPMRVEEAARYVTEDTE